MGNDQTRIVGHVEITGLGCDGDKLKGKTVTVFTVDGNAVTGEVIEANIFVVYITESEEKMRMIKTAAIASISMSTEDAEQLMAKEKIVLPIPTVVTKRPISVPMELPRF